MVTPRVALVGVGQMGWQLARRLAEAGFVVTAFDPRAEVRQRLPEIGVLPAATAREASAASDVTLLMVLNTDQADSAIWGEDGIAQGLSANSLLIVMSSLPPSYLIALASRAGDDFAVLDAPVSGGVEGATAGTLTIMASGDSRAFALAGTILDAVGEVVNVGATPGLGATMKTVNQAMYFAAFASASEMVVAAVKAGLDADQVIDVIGRSSGSSWALLNRVPLAWRNDYHSGGALAIAAKDLRAALDLTKDLAIDVPVTAAAAALVQLAMDRNDGLGDDPLIVETVEAHAGFRIAARD